MKAMTPELKRRTMIFVGIVLLQVLLVLSLSIYRGIALRGAQRIVLPAVRVERYYWGMPKEERRIMEEQRDYIEFRPRISRIDTRKGIAHAGAKMPQGNTMYVDIEKKNGTWEVVYYHQNMGSRKPGTVMLRGMGGTMPPQNKQEEKRAESGKWESPILQVDLGFGSFYKPAGGRAIPTDGLALEVYLQDNGRPVSYDLLHDGKSLGLKAKFTPLGSGLE